MSINPYLLCPSKLECIISSLLTALQNFKTKFWILWHCLRTSCFFFVFLKELVISGQMKKMHPFLGPASQFCLLQLACVYTTRALHLFPIEWHWSSTSRHSQVCHQKVLRDQGGSQLEGKVSAQNGFIQTRAELMLNTTTVVLRGGVRCPSFIRGFMACRGERRWALRLCFCSLCPSSWEPDMLELWGDPGQWWVICGFKIESLAARVLFDAYLTISRIGPRRR